MDKKVTGVCYIGQHVKKTGYVLQRFAYESAKGWHVQIEPLFTPLSNDEMAQRGLSLIVELLQNTPDSRTCKTVSYHDEATKKQGAKLRRNHVFVQVELSQSRDK